MGTKTEILGDYREQAVEKPLSDASLLIGCDDLLQHWRRVSLSSDFFAKYFSFYFPYREKAKGRLSRDAAENSISFVLNELLENTAKYSNTPEKGVKVHLQLLEKHIVLEVSNFVTPELASGFQASMREVLASNAEELYIKKLEANVDRSKSDSGLGFLTLINDYKVGLGFKFETTRPDLCRITVQATMNSEEV